MMLPRSPRPAERAFLDDVLGAAGVHEHRHAELRGLGPERVVLRQRQIFAVDVSADRGAAQAEPLDAVLELLGGEIGILQRDRRERDEAIGMRRDPLREPLVLRPDDPPRQIAIGGVPPEAVDGQRLHVDALLIHDLQPLRARAGCSRPAALFASGVPLTMSATGITQCAWMSITRIAAAADRHLPARRGRLR